MKIQSILAAGLLMMFGACTDLSENLYDKINANEYGQTDSEIASIMGRANASLRGGSFDGANGYAFCQCVLQKHNHSFRQDTFLQTLL